MSAVVVNNLSYCYQKGGKHILKDLNFTVEQGQIVAVLGLSGSGKSTLCLCLGGIIPHYFGGEMTGQVLINGQDTAKCKIARLALEVGIVFQDADTQLFSPIVEDEIAFAPENLCLPPEQIRYRVDAVIDMVGINHLRYENTNNLSGGQKHLVAMASVLTLDPSILVLDEVLAQLDAAVKENVIEILLELCRQGKTIIIVEHDLEAVTIADRVLLLEDGMLVNDGPASILQDKELLARHKLLI
ncbi:Energy-coupling factor transporter ATP-binding protein EcfA3 [Sporotomaculum syntrophicum]|uniref:Energy-coupling factor transporter ATP-binding protein EcfA3 n=1 Tax=Sporotomaculum syntrophicum TaxID=182264 RepID=A0A9D2WMN1_9FIRM|nr:ABC transporter ATP-binding protein [Sporotomaculum syntrophicum]KAF1083795.1 Energy-coupling factor transporter ATP-binding protein EcfA3 [Sporotomaculum syntrophicum]